MEKTTIEKIRDLGVNCPDDLFLHDLPHVLREIGEIKKWQKLCGYCEGTGEITVSVEQDNGLGEIQQDICGRCNGKGIGDWKYHWLKIAEFFAEGGMPASEAYLLTLIK